MDPRRRDEKRREAKPRQEHARPCLLGSLDHINDRQQRDRVVQQRAQRSSHSPFALHPFLHPRRPRALRFSKWDRSHELFCQVVAEPYVLPHGDDELGQPIVGVVASARKRWGRAPGDFCSLASLALRRVRAFAGRAVPAMERKRPQMACQAPIRTTGHAQMARNQKH